MLGLVLSNLWLLLIVLMGVVSLHLLLKDRFLWKRSLKLAAIISTPLFVLNILVFSYGETVLFSFRYPIFEIETKVTQEALLFSVGSFFKLSVILLAFSLGALLIKRDQFFQFISKVLPKSGLVILLACTFISELKVRYYEICQAMYVKGLIHKKQGMFSKFKLLLLIWKPLLRTSLEDAWYTAEALHSKSYG